MRCERGRNARLAAAHIFGKSVCVLPRRLFFGRSREASEVGNVAVDTRLARWIRVAAFCAVGNGLAPVAAARMDDSKTGIQTSTARPPRVDGVHVGVSLGGHATALRLTDDDQASLLPGGAIHLSIGEDVLPWLTLGLNFGSIVFADDTRRATTGYLMVDAGLYPLFRLRPELQPSIRIATGVGGGFVRTEGKSTADGVGGASMRFAARLEWFPTAKQRRPRRGGGFAIAPEIGVYLFPPSARGKTTAQSYYASVVGVYHFGR